MMNIDPAIWLTGAGLVLLVAFLLNWRATLFGYVASTLIVYGYLQVSSVLQWLPHYKDGGNGSARDADIRLFQAAVLNLILLGIAKGIRAAITTVRR